MSASRREALVAGMAALAVVALVAGSPGCGAPRPPAEGVEWTASCSADSAGVGDPFRIELRGLWPAARGEAALAWSPSPDTLLVAARDSSGVRAPAGWNGRAYRLTLLASRPGVLKLPPIALVGAQGETLALAQVGLLRVGSRVGGEAQADLRPLAPFASLRGFPWLAAGAAALLLAGAIAAWLLLRRRRLRALLAPEAPPVPPMEEFRLGMEALVGRRRLERGEFRDFVQELSWVLRRYLGRRWERPALEATRPEIVGWLPATRLCVRDQGRLASWLEETDRIKFAGEIPLSRRAEELLEEAREIAGRTEEIFAREEAARAEAAMREGAARADEAAREGAARTDEAEREGEASATRGGGGR